MCACASSPYRLPKVTKSYQKLSQLKFTSGGTFGVFANSPEQLIGNQKYHKVLNDTERNPEFTNSARELVAEDPFAPLARLRMLTPVKSTAVDIKEYLTFRAARGLIPI